MMLIHIVSAGVINEAPRLSEIVLNVLRVVLQFVGALAVLMVVISGIIYIRSAGDTRRIDYAKKALITSVIGVGVSLAALIIVGVIARGIA